MSVLVTVKAPPNFAASLVVAKGGRVTEAAPILRWAIGKPWLQVRDYFMRKGWEWSEQPDPAVKP